MTSTPSATSSEPDAPAQAQGIPADVPYLRTVKSYVLRAGRTTVGQAKAYELFGPANLLNYQAAPLDTAAAFLLLLGRPMEARSPLHRMTELRACGAAAAAARC